MTPDELVIQLAEYKGPCMRFCSYCPEEFNTAEVKECIEQMIKDNYAWQQEVKSWMKKYLILRWKYEKLTGIEYDPEEKGSSEDED